MAYAIFGMLWTESRFSVGPILEIKIPKGLPYYQMLMRIQKQWYTINNKGRVTMEIQNFYIEILKILDAQLIKTLTVNSKIKMVKKGCILQHIGSISTELYFLAKGLLRGFLLDAKGKEVTDCFAYIQGTPVVSCADLGAPSLICIEALEDSELISIPCSIVLPLLAKNLELISLYNRLLRDSLKMHWENKTVFVQCTGTERYQWF